MLHHGHQYTKSLGAFEFANADKLTGYGLVTESPGTKCISLVCAHSYHYNNNNHFIDTWEAKQVLWVIEFVTSWLRPAHLPWLLLILHGTYISQPSETSHCTVIGLTLCVWHSDLDFKYSALRHATAALHIFRQASSETPYSPSML